jgi:hypothetical protein
MTDFNGIPLSNETSLLTIARRFEEYGARLIAADALEIALDAAAGELDVFGDEWTLHLEGWPTRPVAWLALDEEPDDPADLAAALDAALDDESIAVLAAVEVSLGRALTAALCAAQDPLSTALADRLMASGP